MIRTASRMRKKPSSTPFLDAFPKPARYSTRAQKAAALKLTKREADMISAALAARGNRPIVWDGKPTAAGNAARKKKGSR
jgi:hypothetical protein